MLVCIVPLCITCNWCVSVCVVTMCFADVCVQCRWFASCVCMCGLFHMFVFDYYRCLFILVLVFYVVCLVFVCVM